MNHSWYDLGKLETISLTYITKIYREHFQSLCSPLIIIVQTLIEEALGNLGEPMVATHLHCRGVHREDASNNIEDPQPRRFAVCRGKSAKQCPTKLLLQRLPEQRELLRQQARALSQQPVDYIPHDSFDDRDAEQLILGHDVELSKSSKKAPPGASSYVASLYETELLSKSEEIYLFRKMNYFKYQAELLRRQLDPEKPCSALLEDIHYYLQEADKVRNILLRCNLRLVVSIAKQYLEPDLAFDDLISDGNIALMRSVEKFDCSRGFRFSTYATWAIRRLFYRTLGNRRQRQNRFMNGQDQVFDLTADERSNERLTEQSAKQVRESIEQILDRLDDRERLIIARRFGLSKEEKPLTLQEIGDQLGISKERVRQLEHRALGKLREFAEEEKLELPSEDLNEL